MDSVDIKRETIKVKSEEDVENKDKLDESMDIKMEDSTDFRFFVYCKFT